MKQISKPVFLDTFELSAAEHNRMSQTAKPVIDKFAAAYDPAIVKLYNDELARIRK